MARERCYKCGEWNCDGGDSCHSDLYDNGVEDAIAAVRDRCKACHNGLVRGATKMVPCPYCVPSIAAIREAIVGAAE